MSLKTPSLTKEQQEKLGTDKVYMRIYNASIIRVEADNEEEANKLLDEKIQKIEKEIEEIKKVKINKE